MKIDVLKVGDEGLELSEIWDIDEVALLIEDVKFIEPVEVYARISKSRDLLDLDIHLRSKIGPTCARCLKEYSIDLDKNFKLRYLLNKDTRIIDPKHEIKEEIIFSLPFKPLCREDCKGLCQNCGTNLNNSSCKCRKSDVINNIL